jgi:hypothetical protein
MRVRATWRFWSISAEGSIDLTIDGTEKVQDLIAESIGRSVLCTS